MLGALVVAAVGIGGYALLVRETDETCFANTAIDGAVQPGGPASADQAFASFLATGAESYGIEQTDVAEYLRSEADGRVTYSYGDTSITATEQPNGWWVGEVERPC